MTTLMRVTVLVTLVAVLAGCGRERQDWQSAQSADTLEAYDQFITRHPQGELAEQARSRVKQLGEERDWQQSAETDTLEAYQVFLLQHPDGKWAQEARIRIENFALAGPAAPAATAVPAGSGEAAPSAAAAPSPAVTSTALPADAAVASLPKPVAAPALPPKAPAPPTPSSAAPPTVPATAPAPAKAPAAATATAPAPAKPAPSPAVAAASSVGYAVQLGAFNTEQKAEGEWKRLSAAHPQQLSALSPNVLTVSTANGVLYRLRSSLPSEAAARSTCDALKTRGQACLVILPGGR